MALYQAVLERLGAFVAAGQQSSQSRYDDLLSRMNAFGLVEKYDSEPGVSRYYDKRDLAVCKRNLGDFIDAQTPSQWLLNSRVIQHNLCTWGRSGLVMEAYELIFDIAGLVFGLEGRRSISRVGVVFFLIDSLKTRTQPTNVEELCGILEDNYEGYLMRMETTR